jgi:hypothetical protein
MIEMLIGAVLLFIGMVIGRLSTRLPSRTQHKEIEPVPVCGCEHHYSMHDAEGRCHDRDSIWEGGKHKVFDCGCQHYTGPEPLPRYIAGPGLS